ncbi:hypothetical protein [Chamaesiphon sp. VAR_48_metabat_403]|uniref:hypothetical protein n=1 Tax=Chamaesiphon sp. VAR_48_metabat_403 TaxID=2964700 RepID=UPI00286E50C1|nr:hypothetical protein [Chamaesiphon sp. VAR_48_metabat_403]
MPTFGTDVVLLKIRSGHRLPSCGDRLGKAHAVPNGRLRQRERVDDASDFLPHRSCKLPTS